jgi:hypothetical protein
MKVRTGFVSNSSSSSFTCDGCGNTESGWDLCLSEAGMVDCEVGHCLCESHLKPEHLKILKDEDQKDYNDDWRWAVPKKYCPICQHDIVLDYELLNFAIVKLNTTKEDLTEEFRVVAKEADDAAKKLGN